MCQPATVLRLNRHAQCASPEPQSAGSVEQEDSHSQARSVRQPAITLAARDSRSQCQQSRGDRGGKKSELFA